MATTQVHRFRSGLEERNAKYLTKKRVKFEYETLKVQWRDMRVRKYTPDFILPNGIIVETKGRFTLPDRNKHKWIQEIHPELDIRFVFSNSKGKLYKGSKTTYGDWCEKNDFLYAHRLIPNEWLTSPGACVTAKIIPLKTKRKD